MTVENIKTHLLEAKPEIIAITHVANSRVNAATKIADWLFSAAESKTVE
ncbi:MAG: hypothetical protein HC827_14740 [Cyanobacteria bacterium RM1_2_2]|nr:hypothetical protein [Cyanobacteria bacterium RM1_2_2]